MIRVHRASIQKDGWKLRFGQSDSGLIVTVFIREKLLSVALEAGLKVAERQISVMQKFNQERQ